MKRNKYIFLITIVLAFSILSMATIYGCGRSGAGKAKDVYYCPMHPSYTSDRPGDCPICNMKLVKKEAKPESRDMRGQGHEGHVMQSAKLPQEKTGQEICVEHTCTMNNCPMLVRTTMKPGERIICPICGEYLTAESGKLVEMKPAGEKAPTVMVSPERQQLIGIKTGPVRRMILSKIIRASGKIAYDPELFVTQEEFIQALKNEENVKDSPLKDVVDRAKLLTESARRKLKLLGMAEDQITELASAKKTDTSLYLPKEGENVWAYISVYEYEIGLIEKGAPVEIETPAYPGEKFQGVVRSIYPVLEAATRTNQVRVEVTNSEGKLKPEMFVNALVKVEMGERLAVPEGAVLDTGVRKIVYLSYPDGVLESREVRVGQRAEGYYEALGGVDEGDIVVTSGNFLVDSESRLKSALGSEEHRH